MEASWTIRSKVMRQHLQLPKSIMECRQWVITLSTGRTLGLLAVGLDLGNQPQSGDVNEAERPLHLLQGLGPTVCRSHAGMVTSGIIFCLVCLDPFGRHSIWNLYTLSIAVPGLGSSS
jgi:hypothetical protein